MLSFFKKSSDWLPVAASAIIALVLILMPTGFEGAAIFTETISCVAEVTAVDNSNIKDTGLLRTGEQLCTIEITDGQFKGEVAEGTNMLSGSLEQDKIFAPGDKARVRINHTDGEITSVSMVDYERLGGELLLLGMFFLFLIIFAGKTGVRAILSFIVSILMIWKVLVPFCLKGFNPIIIGAIITALLTLIIISLVYGFDRRCLSAVSGAIAGLVVTCIIGIIATDGFRIHGAVMSYSESLLYSGYSNLNLTKIFMASIFIGSSGAVMDLAVDITSAVHEVVEKKPDITKKEAIKSGFNVGRAAMGTMTTTLLLAYSGGYLALLMVFMAQGTPLVNVFNYKYVAAEMIHTIVGSFGLVTAAPLTAVMAGLFLAKEK